MGTVVLDKFEKKILKKYRLVHVCDNFSNNTTKLVIEKRCRFLFWSWWSRSYAGGDCYYTFSEIRELDNMKRKLSILNGELEWYTTKVIEE